MSPESSGSLILGYMGTHGHDHDHDLEAGKKITWSGMGVNALLIVLKLGGGFYGHSRALLADGVHSISDFVSDIVVLVGLHFFGKEEDESHPYGHGKIETLAAIGVGLLLLFAAFKIGYEAAISIYRHEAAIPGWFTIIIAAISIVSKEAMFHATRRIGRNIGSEAMIANAWHHRSDAMSSVVTLTGISLAVFVPSLHILDSYAALLVTFFIVKVAADILKNAVKKIIDTSPSKEFIDGVCEVASEVPGVLACHDTMARYYASRIRMEIHIEVDPEMTV
ncbi:MAG TPA: cation diffusion facilitator family transporter, partial [Candidatus Krumholzibacterium sp.]|nr:cation diffusion facilitator family transporter [Candidatus Krumholzibacterium sp.]